MITASLRATAAVALRWQPRLLSFRPKIFRMPKPKKGTDLIRLPEEAWIVALRRLGVHRGTFLDRRNEDPTAFACA